MRSQDADANGPRRLSVTSAEFVRQFGHWRQHLGASPLFVTHHGRPTHVFLTADAYRHIEATAHAADQVPNDGLPASRELAGWLPFGMIVCDRDLKVRLVNTAARGLIGRGDGDETGKSLWEALPELEGSLAQVYIRRCVNGGERTIAELPAVFRPDSWLRFAVVPFSEGFVLMFTDITEDVRVHRYADVRQALVDTMTRHPAIGHARLTVRGEIESCDETLCALLALPEERLRTVSFSDLATVASRPALRAAIGAVLREGEPRTVETEIHTNAGAAVPVCLSLSALRGAYGIEGAVLTLTRR